MPEWSQDKPAEPGYYWRWAPGMSEPILVTLRMLSIDVEDGYWWLSTGLEVPPPPEATMSPWERALRRMAHEQGWVDNSLSELIAAIREEEAKND